MAESRHIRLTTPLDDGVLLPYRLTLHEEMSRPYQYDLELLSLDPAIKLEDVLGLDMTIEMETGTDEPRLFHGHVARFGQGGVLGRYTRYHATLRPFLWFLTRASDSRIFQGLSVPEVVKEVLGLHGYSDIDSQFDDDHSVREYCVQYRESDFDFVSRLLEEEGISYHFLHEKDRHTLVLRDSNAGHKAMPGAEKIPYIPPHVSETPREAHIEALTVARTVQSGTFTVNDYDFETPRADLRSAFAQARPHARAEFKQYDPLAGFVDAHDVKEGSDGDPRAKARAELFARVRLEELQTECERIEATGDHRWMLAGATFELTEHSREDMNIEYLITSVRHEANVPGYDAAEDDDEDEAPLYTMTMIVQPNTITFRPARLTPRPIIAGPHAGLVVGADGDEIMTDEFARVKVRFPWDVNSTGKDDCGCWVRVSQPIAGGGWGALFLPRVGQEVVVEFVEGDPDRPVIMGRLYNGTNTPPFGLPGGATQSGYLSRSSKGGGAANANELRFEDKTGTEMFFQHAEKDMSTEVENDQTTWVGHDRSKTVDNDQFEEVKGFKTIKVHKDHTEDIVQDMTLRVKGSEQESIDGDRTITIGGNHTETIGGIQGVTVGGMAAWSVGGAGAITFGGTGMLAVGGNHNEAIGGDFGLSVGQNGTIGISDNLNISTGKNMGIKVTQAMTIAVTKDCTTTVDGVHKLTVKKNHGVEAKEIVIEAADSLILKAGSAQITLKKNGDILIKGAKINVKGDSDVVLKGSKIAQN